jgi:integrase
MRKQLTEAMIGKLAPPATGRIELFDAIVPGLALRVSPNGAKSFTVRGRVRGQASPLRITIGDAMAMKLAEARQIASDTLRAMKAGSDPREIKRAAVEATKRELAKVERERRNTFEAVAEAFIAEHVSKLRAERQTASEIRRYLIAAWGPQPITSITDDDVGEVIREIGEAGKTAQARRVLAHAKRLFRWAAAPARPRDERLRINPTLALSATKDFDLHPAPRQVALSSDHLRAIWTAADKLGERFAPFFRLLLLCGQRRSEVAEMTWGELDLDRDQVWNIGAGRMKAKRPHEVPLSPPMVRLLTELREHRGPGPFVFSTTFGHRPISGFSKVKMRLDRLIAEARGADGLPVLAPWTVHDVRRAVRTGLGAIPSVPHDIRELVIAHVPPALVQTYDLHAYRDEKRQALALWGERLARIVEPPPVGNVTPLRVVR